MVIASFLGFLILFLGIGLASARQARGDRQDYYLASRTVSPMFVGLSAVATNNSGYMFIGVIGYTYAVGLASIWLMFGWIAGDFLASLFIHRRLRVATEQTGEASFGAVLARWNGTDMQAWRRIAALVTVLFLGAYAAAQIAAGGKALEGVLGWDRTTGAWIVAAMVLAYSIAGGIRASIWTDVAQSAVMVIAMAILVFAGVSALGGIGHTVAEWQAIPGYFDLTPPDLITPGLPGLALFILGWLFAGLSVIGQPHVMVRFMALDNATHMTSARAWYYGFFTAFYALATMAGMLARLHLPQLGGLDPEMALPTMARHLLSPFLVGVILAGVFAATMSTADSLVLSCSAALTHDLLPERIEHPALMKLATAGVTILALGIAISDNSSVFDLVILAWSTLAVTFGPLLILLAIGRQVSQIRAIIMMLAGIGVALAWRQAGLQDMLYEGLPGMFAGLLVGLPWSSRAMRVGL
ncbi:sodium/proline symporter [Croceicoccus estronivorus]|uniref:sodium/proline symporter n=1 Tax=Croceicoccus estronivorus TaxID=1172626 RepID=UPI000AE7EF73|nr:sodium/proline symporter [Croceicoccus estronivorus]